jgi:hypothetical protein
MRCMHTPLVRCTGVELGLFYLKMLILVLLELSNRMLYQIEERNLPNFDVIVECQDDRDYIQIEFTYTCFVVTNLNSLDQLLKYHVL